MAKAVKAAPKKAAVSRKLQAVGKVVTAKSKPSLKKVLVDMQKANKEISWEKAIHQPGVREKIIEHLGLNSGTGTAIDKTEPVPVSKSEKGPSPLFNTQIKVLQQTERIARRLGQVSSINDRLSGAKNDFADFGSPLLSPENIIDNNWRIMEFMEAVANTLESQLDLLDSKI